MTTDVIDALEFMRDQKGMTQKAFSSSLGMQASHYNEFVKGKRNLPLSAMRAAVEVHKVSAELLITGKFPAPKKPNDYSDLVDNFLKWPLPKTLNPDQCVHDTSYPHRIGTHLMTADEALQMFKFCLEEQP